VKTRGTVGVALVAVVFYLGLIGWRAVQLLTQSSWTARGLGAGVALLPVVGVVVVVREVQFGRATTRLGRQLPPDDPAGDAPSPVRRRPSGRIDRAAADEIFDQWRSDVEAHPRDWRAWYRLAVAYGDAGDIRRGRRAMRHAIALERIRPAG
jgi:hypothetical protein